MNMLNFYPASNIDNLTHPESSEALTIDSPALEFFTDFSKSEPVFIEAGVSALDVQNLMQKSHVRLKFVIDPDEKFLGIVSLDDISDRKIMQKKVYGETREDVTLSDVMRPKKTLSALDYSEIKSASIGQVINALKCSGVQHALVIDRKKNSVRGIFSTSDISRKLKLPIDIHDKPSFSKVFEITD